LGYRSIALRGRRLDLVAEGLDVMLELLLGRLVAVEGDGDEVLVVVPFDPCTGMSPFQGPGDLVRSAPSCRAGRSLLESEDMEGHGRTLACEVSTRRVSAGEEGAGETQRGEEAHSGCFETRPPHHGVRPTDRQQEARVGAVVAFC
jgi:hypothetical protein